MPKILPILSMQRLARQNLPLENALKVLIQHNIY
jgi:hypothetical protein